MTAARKPLLILVRGVGDVGSAVAHWLFLDGHAMALHDGPAPTTAHRRGTAFADAVFGGSAELDGVAVRLVDGPQSLIRKAWRRAFVPVATGPAEPCLSAATWDVVVDARMRKRASPEDQRGLARIVIGLGPGFVAGSNADIAIETAWGERLGSLVEAGPTAPLGGEPRSIDGIGRERMAYAPANGVWRTARVIGDPVAAGQVIGRIGENTVAAPIDGALRGLTRDGVPVSRGTKLVEVDPRGPGRAQVHGIGEPPRHIAAGVAMAVEPLSAGRIRQTAVGSASVQRSLG